MTTIAEDPEDQPKFTLSRTNAVLHWLLKDLQNLRSDPDIQFFTAPTVWVEGIYRPPGLWCRFQGDRTKKGSRLMWWFPEPYHPLEILAAYRGLGGGKTDSFPTLGYRDWKTLEDLEKIRYSGWAEYTKAIARTMFILPSQARVLYHAFTPLATNGCDPMVGATMRLISSSLFKTALGENNRWVTALMEAWGIRSDGLRTRWAIKREPVGLPTRMKFWGDEVSGRVEI